jgi:hypothetical protein
MGLLSTFSRRQAQVLLLRWQPLSSFPFLSNTLSLAVALAVVVVMAEAEAGPVE